ITKYHEKYQDYDVGIALGKQTFEQHLAAQPDKTHIVTAAEEAIIEIALKEVVIRSKKEFAYSARDRQQLRILRIARTTIRSTMSQQIVYNDLVSMLATKDLLKPALQGSYADIVWANER